MKSCNTNKPASLARGFVSQASQRLSRCEPSSQQRRGAHTAPRCERTPRRPGGTWRELSGARRWGPAGPHSHPRRILRPAPHWRCPEPPSRRLSRRGSRDAGCPRPSCHGSARGAAAPHKHVGTGRRRGRNRAPTNTRRERDEPAPGPSAHLYPLADAGRHGAGRSPSSPDTGRTEGLGHGCPLGRPGPPASAHPRSLPGTAGAAPRPPRRHFEKSRRYPPAPPRPGTRLRLTQPRHAAARAAGLGGGAAAARARARRVPRQPLGRVRCEGRAGRLSAVRPSFLREY